MILKYLMFSHFFCLMLYRNISIVNSIRSQSIIQIITLALIRTYFLPIRVLLNLVSFDMKDINYFNRCLCTMNLVQFIHFMNVIQHVEAIQMTFVWMCVGMQLIGKTCSHIKFQAFFSFIALLSSIVTISNNIYVKLTLSTTSKFEVMIHFNLFFFPHTFVFCFCLSLFFSLSLCFLFLLHSTVKALNRLL